MITIKPFLELPFKEKKYKITAGWFYDAKDFITKKLGSNRHFAIDFGLKEGTSVIAAASGWAISSYHHFLIKNQKDKRKFIRYKGNLVSSGQGNFVIITNSGKIKVSGKKETQKMYYRHSGYPGGLKSESLGKLRSRRPEEILRHAIVGMLPKGSLGRGMITKLYIFAGETHNMDRQLGIKKEKVAEKVEEQAVASA